MGADSTQSTSTTPQESSFLPDSLLSAYEWAQQKKDEATSYVYEKGVEVLNEADAAVVARLPAEYLSDYQEAKQTILSVSESDVVRSLANTARQHIPNLGRVAVAQLPGVGRALTIVNTVEIAEQAAPVAEECLQIAADKTDELLRSAGQYVAEKLMEEFPTCAEAYETGAKVLTNIFDAVEKGEYREALKTAEVGAKKIYHAVVDEECEISEPKECLVEEPENLVSFSDEESFNLEFRREGNELIEEEREPVERAIATNEEMEGEGAFIPTEDDCVEERRAFASTDLGETSESQETSGVATDATKTSVGLGEVAEADTEVAAAETETAEETRSADLAYVASAEVQSDGTIESKDVDETGASTLAAVASGEAQNLDPLFVSINSVSDVVGGAQVSVNPSDAAQASLAAEQEEITASAMRVEVARSSARVEAHKVFAAQAVVSRSDVGRLVVESALTLVLPSAVSTLVAGGSYIQTLVEQQKQSGQRRLDSDLAQPGLIILSGLQCFTKLAQGDTDVAAGSILDRDAEKTFTTVASKADTSSGHSDSDHADTTNIVREVMAAALEGAFDAKDLSTDLPRFVNLGSLRSADTVIC